MGGIKNVWDQGVPIFKDSHHLSCRQADVFLLCVVQNSRLVKFVRDLQLFNNNTLRNASAFSFLFDLPPKINLQDTRPPPRTYHGGRHAPTLSPGDR
jgi:hypothetical protein